MPLRIVPLAVLAGLFAYIGARLLWPLPLAWALVGGVGLVVLFGLLMLPLVALAGHRDRHPQGPLMWAGWIGVGLFSSLLVLTLLRDGVLAGAALLGHAGALPRIDVASALMVPALALAASGIGFFNARRRPAVRRVEVPIEGLPAALDGFTIAQVTDLHVGPTIRRDFVERVVDAVNAVDADMVALTGDLVDGSVAALAPHVAPLARLRARHGVFGVTGNHEYYSGADAWVAEFRRLGIDMLMNEHRLLRHGDASLAAAGVTDPSAHHFDPARRSDAAQALAGAPADAVRLLLAHQPRSADGGEQAGADLQLSGHTHGGQFVPWNWFVPLQQPYTAGLHRHGRLWVYVSRGTGYWGPPKRLGAPSEITQIVLRPAAP